MAKPNAEELAQKIEYIDFLQRKILDNIKEVQKNIKNLEYPCCHRARFHQYRIIIQKELKELEDYIYGRD